MKRVEFGDELKPGENRLLRAGGRDYVICSLGDLLSIDDITDAGKRGRRCKKLLCPMPEPLWSAVEEILEKMERLNNGIYGDLILTWEHSIRVFNHADLARY